MAYQAGYDQPENRYLRKYPNFGKDELPSYQSLGTQQQSGSGQPPSYESATYVVSRQPQQGGTVIYRSRPPDYLIPSIIACLFCFWPTGLCAVVYAKEANDKAVAGDFRGAERMATKARNMLVSSVVIGAIIWISSGIITYFLIYNIEKNGSGF
ncbi:proline rich transmembrane protein 1B-like isoform X2 [Mercenaria mercenaria]|uniref:proline rich transmembrane protein 1B-like isoform X2 n=1 Tax=Mercenaria mercenaria TaxID=6596 RepID=UPI001E1E19BB|nr:proline rich transmembrane protein 1B-like isoform X2 [Mercenaria mercenaria]